MRVTFTRSTVPSYGPLTTGRNGIGQYAMRIGVQSYGRGKPHGIALKSVRASVHVTTPVPSYFDIEIGRAEGHGDGDSALTPDVHGALATMGHQRSVMDTIQYFIGMGIERTAATAIVRYDNDCKYMQLRTRVTSTYRAGAPVRIGTGDGRCGTIDGPCGTAHGRWQMRYGRWLMRHGRWPIADAARPKADAGRPMDDAGSPMAWVVRPQPNAGSAPAVC